VNKINPDLQLYLLCFLLAAEYPQIGAPFIGRLLAASGKRLFCLSLGFPLKLGAKAKLWKFFCGHRPTGGRGRHVQFGPSFIFGELTCAYLTLVAAASQGEIFLFFRVASGLSADCESESDNNGLRDVRGTQPDCPDRGAHLGRPG